MQSSDDDKLGNISLMSVTEEVEVNIDTDIATTYAMTSPEDWNMVIGTNILEKD